MPKAKPEIFKTRKTNWRTFPPLHSKVYQPPTPRTVAKMIERAKIISRHLDEVKPLYQELDEITLALANVRNTLHPKHGVVIVDNFKEKNTRFKTVGIRRFEIKWTVR